MTAAAVTAPAPTPLCRDAQDEQRPCVFAQICHDVRQRLHHKHRLRGTDCWYYVRLSHSTPAELEAQREIPAPVDEERAAIQDETTVFQPRASLCRSCQAAVLWVKTHRGKNMPLDAAETTTGTTRFVIGTDGTLRRAMDGEPGRESHFSSCPNAAKHRKKSAA